MQRALLAALAVVLVALPATATAAPSAETAATASVRVGDYFFKPSFTRVEPGDSVTWTFGGADVHNVTSQVSSPELFGSGDKLPGATYTRTFANAGRFAYVCTIHEEMKGVVQVGPDTVDPSFARTRVERRKRSVRVSFRLSEPAKVSAFVTKRGKKRKLRRARARSLEDGSQSISVKTAGLAPGRYRVTVSAKDADGNAGTTRAGFRIPRP